MEGHACLWTSLVCEVCVHYLKTVNIQISGFFVVGNDPFCFDLCSQDTCIYTSLFDECESISKICLINCDD